jgi:hypothetical protein
LSGIVIRKWKDIQADFKHNLFLGNGASISIFDKFDYPSLHSLAEKKKYISDICSCLFKDFETDNFEYILQVLADANKVNQILRIDEQDTLTAYDEIRNALVNTIRYIHPQRDSVESMLRIAGDFMSKFNTIITLNYDLLLYWAILLFNKNNGRTHFKDCFIPNMDHSQLVFESDFNRLRSPLSGTIDASLVFYPHGNLILADSPIGTEVKLVRNDEYILDTIMDKWAMGNYTPLIVSESDSKHKLFAIERSNYLTNVYTRVLSEIPETLVIYGWRFSDHDSHIMKALDRSMSPSISSSHKQLEHMAISVHTSNPDHIASCERIRQKLNTFHNLKKCTVTWFDSESSGCWIHK